MGDFMRASTSKFIKKKFEIEEEGKTTTYKIGGNKQAEHKRHIFLIGPRGSGKTTIGIRIAELLNLPFADTDERITRALGRSIAAMVAEQGWDSFRRCEHETLAKLCAEPRQVVATGGGIVLLPENRILLKTHGTVFYLLAGISTLIERLAADPMKDQRPSLTGLPWQAEIATVVADREPLYLECADHILQVEQDPATLAQEAVDKLSLVF